MKSATLTILFFTFSLSAGDAANFLSLGWSPDDHYFAFAQYGEQDGSGFPYAEIFIVDVKANDFVPGGANKKLWSDEPDAQCKGIHVLLEMRAELDSLLQEYSIIPGRQNQLVVPVETGEREQVEWRDINGQTNTALLVQDAKGNADMLISEAAFQLELKRGDSAPIIIGNKARFRKYILRYDIDHVMASEDQTSLVFVIRLTKIGFEGPDIRFMVETVKVTE